MRGLAILIVFFIALIVGYYYGSTYSSPLFIREISPTTTTITTTTTTTTTPTTRIYAVKIYPIGINYIGGEDSIDAEIHFGFRLKPPPTGYKYFLFSNLSPSYFTPYLGSLAFSCNHGIYCDAWGECEETDTCEFVEFHEYNSTHIYAFTYASCDSMFFIPVRYPSYEEDKIKNTWIAIVLVEENATLEQIMSNLYIA